MVQLISVTMAGSQATVRVDNQYTSTSAFLITNSVTAGCTALCIIRFGIRNNISEDEYHWIYRNKKYTNFCIC